MAAQFFGPCPNNRHTCEFTFYSIDTGTLPGVDKDSRPADVIKALARHTTGTATLRGYSSASADR